MEKMNLKMIIEKGLKEEYGILDYYIFSKLSIPITMLMLYLNISPNLISILSLFLRFLSIYYIVDNDLLFASFLVFLGQVMDCVDGNIARLTNSSSFFGKILDLFVDRISYSLIFWTLVIKFYMVSNNLHLIILAVLFNTLSFSFDSLRAHIEKNSKVDIHRISEINSVETNIKTFLKKILPFINWDRIIIGIGADLLWTFLILSIFSEWLFTVGLIVLTLIYSISILITFKSIKN
jgi:phosphatidylglycerophosphate synthase